MQIALSVLQFKELCDDLHVTHIRLDASKDQNGQETSYMVQGIYAQPNVIGLRADDQVIALYHIKNVIIDEIAQDNKVYGSLIQYNYHKGADVIERPFVGYEQTSKTS